MEYSSISQPRRLLHLFLYLCVLFVVNYFAFGQWVPLTDQRGLWFFGGLAALLIGSLIVTPFFTSPANAISYATAALVAVVSLKPLESNLTPLFISVVGFCSLIIISSVVNIALKDRPQRTLINIANTSRLFADVFGNPRFLYSIILIYSLFCFHLTTPNELFWISIAGILIIAARPFETLDSLITSTLRLWLSDPKVSVFGSIVAYQAPNIVLIRQHDPNRVLLKQPIVLHDPLTTSKLGITLDLVGRDEGMLVRAIQVPVSDSQRSYVEDIVRQLPHNVAASVESTVVDELKKENPVVASAERLVGIVAPDTSIDTLYFEVIEDRDLEEGKLVETQILGNRIIYQIINGLTKEDFVYQRNTFGYARAQARKIGLWDAKAKKFIPARWLPPPNSPVFLKIPEKLPLDEKVVGRFPGSDYSVSVKSYSDLVTHNTAILGILGVGKSMLAIELVERLITDGIKVICIDLTNQYQKELIDFYDSAREQKIVTALQAIGVKGKTAYARNKEEGGSIRQFSDAVFKDIRAFADPESSHVLKIYNPSQFEVWLQDSKMFDNAASMATLTPAAITRMITESALQVCQSFGMTDKARLCLVFEEAHSLVPEWTTVAAEGDKEATNGTARAILQGRKFGLGCLLVTQRTANVTKTILNQCNTIFALRTFDETGKDFLANYFGSDYASLLSGLQDRHAVFFGRASSCENPVLVRLNDQDKFRAAFRAVHKPAPIPPVQAPKAQPPAPQEGQAPEQAQTNT